MHLILLLFCYSSSYPPLSLSHKRQRHGTLNSSTRRKSTRERKPSKGDLQSRPDWSLFTRVNEGSENILFREKFSDWPEPGRIIKMKGHESSGEVAKVLYTCVESLN